MGRKIVGIVLFNNIEILDFCGPFEVFSATRLNEEKRREEPSPFEVLLVAENSEPLVTTGNMRVIPDYAFNSCPKLDILCVRLPHMRFLFVGPGICLRLPSDSTSRRTPLPSG